MNETIISVENINKIYNLYNKPIDRMKEALSFTRKSYHQDHYALKDVSFTVNKGENMGIMGVNGSGKSTLLKIITGLLTPSNGMVDVRGKVSALLELGAGFNPEFTGMENIYLNGTMMGFSREEIEGKIDSILAFADIGEFITQPIKTYSSGMFARLAFAVAINVEPDILIIDEVLAVGDTRFQIKCMNKMKQMMGEGTTVLFVAHDINAIRRFCSRAIWLNQGKVMMDGDVNSVADAYLGFLKVGEVVLEEERQNERLDTIVQLPDFNPLAGDTIAEIKNLRVLNKHGEEISEAWFNEPVTVEVIYDVYDATIENPVLGVALKGLDDDYVCGLNTLLDRFSIPWQHGRNKAYLKYYNGLLAVGGKYCFDTALFEQTATVPIQYITMITEFTLLMDYIGEGRFVIPHRWLA